MMKRSYDSLTSLHSNSSLSSINEQTNIFDNRYFQKNITYLEEDIINVTNNYHLFAEKYDKKIGNFINRYENKTNKLYIDLRYREAECRKLNMKIECKILNMLLIKNKLVGNY